MRAATMDDFIRNGLTPFEIVGAGYLLVDLTPYESRCGKAIGARFAESWGPYAGAGGVMDAEVMRELHSKLGAWLEAFDKRKQEAKP